MSDKFSKADFQDLKNINVEVDLKGIRQFMDAFNKLLRIQARVGILNDKEAAKYMSEQEFGHQWKEMDVWVPARPWMRNTIIRIRDKIKKKLGKGLMRVFSKRTQSPTFHELQGIIESVADFAKKEFKITIQEHVPPPLSKITIQEKKERNLPTPETPLYATGRAYNAIDYRIVRTNPARSVQ